MSNFLTRRLAMSMSLAALVAALATPISAQQSRWECIGKTETKEWYLDIRTVSRPSRDIVVFWYKAIEPEEKNQITMTRDRRYKFDGDRDWKPIPPESMIEAFYERLFK